MTLYELSFSKMRGLLKLRDYSALNEVMVSEPATALSLKKETSSLFSIKPSE